MNAAGLLLPAPRAVRCLVRVPTAVAPVVLLERDAVLLAVVIRAVGLEMIGCSVGCEGSPVLSAPSWGL